MCQIAEKPNLTITPAPFNPIREPFEQVTADLVGPLAQSKSGGQYLLTIMRSTAYFPEVVSLWNITVKAAARALGTYFYIFSLPRSFRATKGCVDPWCFQGTSGLLGTVS